MMEPEILDLKDVDFHANWKLENTCKSFKSLKQSTKHQEDKDLLSIEALLFDSYLYMSDIKGNDENDIVTAKETNEEAIRAISDLPDKIPQSIKNGYKSMYLALKCWFPSNQSEKKNNDEELKNLLTEYRDSAENDKRMFEASVHASKGFALSRLTFSRYKESENELKLATKKFPENVEWKFMRGLITWRRNAGYIYKFEWSDGMNQVEKIMKEVLELDTDHAYAKTILADIYRRKYHQESKNNTSSNLVVVHSLVFENGNNNAKVTIMDLLKTATKKASNTKVLSLIAQCYIRMGDCKCRSVKGNWKCSEPKYDSIYFKEAQNVIECAKEKYGQAACILVQEAVLYREKNDTKKQLECLNEAISLNISDAGAKLQRADALASLGKDAEAISTFDNLLSDFKHDLFITFNINLQYSKYFRSKKQFDEAANRTQICLKIALQLFAKNNSCNEPIEFIEHQRKRVDEVISKLKKHFNIKIKKSKGRDKVKPNLQNAELHEQIHDFKNACSYYRGALRAFHYENTPNTRHDEEVAILVKFANVNLKIGNLDVCNNIVSIIKCETCVKEKDHVRQLTMKLCVAKGEKAAESGDSIEAIRMFTLATKMRSLDAAKRLLEETKKIEDNTLRMSALKSIASVTKSHESWSKEFNLEQELAELLPLCDNGTFIGKKIKPLRDFQLEMEYSILMDDDKIATNISIVLQQGRNILNHAMEYFGKKHYPNSKAKSVDFIIIPKPEKAVDQRVKKVLDSRKWKDFQIRFRDLFEYLVSIQPATDAKFEWLEVLNDLNNDDKHRDPLKKSKETISVARDACANIEDILKEIYKWAQITDNASW